MPGVGYDIDSSDLDDIYMAPSSTQMAPQNQNDAIRRRIWPTLLKTSKIGSKTAGAMMIYLPWSKPYAFNCRMSNSEYDLHRCIVTYTPSGYPTIDAVPSDPHGRLFVATGGKTGALF